MKHLALLFLSALLAACATAELKPGEARLEDVLRVMGRPAMRWQEPDGSQQLAYPHGPMGMRTEMAWIAADGRLQRIENVLDPKVFARVRAGMDKNQVLRLLGPSYPGWTVYFKARDELVWEWRYCDEWLEPARFDVLFDAGKEVVRSTLSQTESQMGLCDQACLCSH